MSHKSAIPAPLPAIIEFGPEHPRDVPYYMAGCLCWVCRKLRIDAEDEASASANNGEGTDPFTTDELE